MQLHGQIDKWGIKLSKEILDDFKDEWINEVKYK